MTTPFKALNPFTPRFIEINYVAPDGGCCALSSSSGSQQSLPDDDPVVPDNFQYFFQPPFGGYTWLMWMQDPSNPAQRVLIEEFFIDGTDPVDITAFFRNIENEQLSGVQRKVFFTQLNSTTSGQTEFSFYTSFSAGSGTAFSLETWDNVPPAESLDGWANDPNVQMVVIENYRQGQATFTVGDPPAPPFGPGSLFKAKQGDTYAYFPALGSYMFNDFTIELGVYVYSSPAPDHFGRIIDHSFSNGFDIQNRSTNRIFFEIMGSNRGGDTDSITLDAWQHFAFRRTGAQLDIFKNGVLIGGGIVTSAVLNLTDGGGFVKFGVTGGGEMLQMNASDFRIWDYARSDADILANYTVRLAGNEAGLSCYYPLCENDSVFNDATGNNVPLTLVNGVLAVPNSAIGYSALTPPWFP